MFLLTSCAKENELIINVNNFSKRIEKTITSKDDVSYTTKRIEVKGYCDDSIYVKFGDKGKPLFLKNKIDTTFIGDYYGGGKIKFIFDPYKSKKRDLHIIFKIL